MPSLLLRTLPKDRATTCRANGVIVDATLRWAFSAGSFCRKSTNQGSWVRQPANQENRVNACKRVSVALDIVHVDANPDIIRPDIVNLDTIRPTPSESSVSVALPPMASKRFDGVHRSPLGAAL